MKCSLLLLFALLAGLQLVVGTPTGERPDFFANVDYNQVVGHMKELLMYLPVLMTTVKETVSGFPKVGEGLNAIHARRIFFGRDGICKCKKTSAEDDNEDNEYR